MNKSVLLIPILLCLSAISVAQNRTVPVEPSETRLNSQHQPEKLMDAIGLREGMVIADIGAGRGRMTVWFADRVGKTGKVYANDIDRDALAYLENRCKNHAIDNVRTFPGKVDHPMLPQGEVDIAFMVSTYHHLEQPVQLMKNTIPCLKKEGMLVIVERDPVKSGASEHESTSKEKLLRQLDDAGFELVRSNTTLLVNDNIYFFKVKK